MKKVLHIPNYYYPHVGGIEKTAQDIVKSLKDKCEQKVICFRDKPKTVYDDVDGINVIRVGCVVKMMSQSLSLTYQRELKKVVKSFSPDIIIFHYPNPFVAHFLIPLLKKNPNIKLVLYWHLDITKQKLVKKLFEGQNEKLLKLATKVIATSPNYVEGSKYLQSVKNKVEVVPSCIGNHNFKQDLVDKYQAIIRKNNEGKKIIFAFGRHVEYKGFKYLISASKLLPKNYSVYLGGSGPLTKDLEFKSKGLKNFEMLGRLSEEMLEAYLNECDVFVFTSITKNEAFGLALAEAMQHKKPVITFNIEGSGVNYVNKKDLTGLEVENSNSEDLARAIVKIVNDKSLYEKFSNNAYKRVLELFTYEKFKVNILNLIDKL